MKKTMKNIEGKIKVLYQEVLELYTGMRNLIVHGQLDLASNREHQKKWDEMVDKAYELHKLVNPKHHKYMLRNRDVTLSDV